MRRHPGISTRLRQANTFPIVSDTPTVATVGKCGMAIA